MGNLGPVYIVDDDTDDQQLIKEIWQDLKIEHPLRFFDNGKEVLHHLKQDATTPFLILSDVNLPVMDGFELRKAILDDSTMENKSVPFIFWSGNTSNGEIKKAYHLAVHGFFIKAGSYEKLKDTIRKIFDYWCRSQQPVM